MKRIEYVKGEAVKYIKENSKLIPILEKDGWKLKQKPKKVEK